MFNIKVDSITPHGRNPINFTESADNVMRKDSKKSQIRAITAVSHEKDNPNKFDHFFDNVQGDIDFEWSDKLKNMEMKDIFDIDLVNIP